MTSVIDKKAERINSRSTFDRRNSMFKFIKTRYSMKKEQDIRYFTSEENSEYTYKKLKKHKKINNACKSLEEFKNTNEIHEFYEGTTEMNEVQSLKNNEHR